MSKNVVFASLIGSLLLVSGCSRNEPAAPAPAATVAATCAAHAAPKDLCFICDRALRETGRLWCDEHGRYEDRCWECHPDLRDPKRAYCEKHGLYQDECFLCKPELAKPAAVSVTLMCAEHGVPEAECGICHPELLADSGGMKVRLPSAGSADKAGIAVGEPGVGAMHDGIACLAELDFDQKRVAALSSQVAGTVTSIAVDLGDRVRAGDLLARIASAAIGAAQSDYLRAEADRALHEKTYEREKRLRAEGIASDQDLQVAEAAYRSAAAAVTQARQHLRVLGFGEKRIASLASGEDASADLEVRAPFAGEIVERKAVAGMQVESGAPLFTLADTGTIWAMVDIPASQLPRARVGQAVKLTVESLPGRSFSGKLTWLPAAIDEHTRMARARVEVANADGALKARMYARALILTGAPSQTLMVPQSAVQTIGTTSVVFVRSEADLFEARPVKLGARHDGGVEVLSGLHAKDPVVVAGSFALKSQFLISRLGAGCAD